MDEWILVKDQLPEEGQDVIYFFEFTGVSVGKYTLEDIGEFMPGATMNVFYGKGGWLGDDVTHWMPYRPGPLPKPPEGFNKNRIDWELIKEE